MENNIKYTKDGKKVKVIGNLNNNQIIVQEIYVDGNSEIPAGEQFIVTSLLDKPMETYKEKALREIEERHNAEYNNYEIKLKELRKRLTKEHAELEQRIAFLREIKAEHLQQPLGLISDFLSGRIQFIFLPNSWEKNVIISVEDLIKSHDYDDWNPKLRLISFYGNLRDRENPLSWERHRYSDGSGSDTTFIPCRTYEEALSLLQSEIDAVDAYRDDHLEKIKNYNLAIDQSKLKKYVEEGLESVDRRLSDENKTIEKIEIQRNKYLALLNEEVK